MANGQAAFPGDPALSIEVHYDTSMPERCNVSKVSFSSHHGTHLDAMFHFVDTGKTLDQMPLDWFYGPARVLRIPKAAREPITVADFLPYESLLIPAAKIIYETGWHRHYGQPDYFEAFPTLTIEAAQFLADKSIRLLGMDTPTPSVDSYNVHHILLGREIVIVESLANLDQLPDEFTFIGFPLNFAGRDGSPIRAVGMVE
jgi:kynurenine formamidase